MEFAITMQQLKAMQSVDPLTVDRSTLVDINDVLIDTTLPKLVRMESFLRQIKNPYCYKCGKVVVKVNYSEQGKTLEERLISHFKSLV